MYDAELKSGHYYLMEDGGVIEYRTEVKIGGHSAIFRRNFNSISRQSLSMFIFRHRVVREVQKEEIHFQANGHASLKGVY